VNLAEPTIGDIVDRLSILSLKPVTSGPDQDEASALMHRLQCKLGCEGISLPTVTRLLSLAAALGAINGRLWEVHERPGDLPLTYAMELNKARRRLVEEIG
jgi:hypothetical protein